MLLRSPVYAARLKSDSCTFLIIAAPVTGAKNWNQPGVHLEKSKQVRRLWFINAWASLNCKEENHTGLCAHL